MQLKNRCFNAGFLEGDGERRHEHDVWGGERQHPPGLFQPAHLKVLLKSRESPNQGRSTMVIVTEYLLILDQCSPILSEIVCKKMKNRRSPSLRKTCGRYKRIAKRKIITT